MNIEAKKSPRNLQVAFEEIREKSPALDQRIRASEGRRSLALALLRIRRQAGLTQRELASAMKSDQAFVSRMESTAGPTPEPASIDAYVHACGAMAGYVFVRPHDGEHDVFAVPFGSADEAREFENIVHWHGAR